MKPIASLSLDLDNLWSYQMTHGDEGWDEYGSYLDVLVPTVLEFLAARTQRITVFVVGQDAALDRNEKAIRAIADDEHGDPLRAGREELEHRGHQDVEVGAVLVPALVAVRHLVRPQVVQVERQ